MADEFFEKWPQELALDLPSGPGVVLTPEQLNALGKATALTKLRLKRVMRYKARRR
ncbi:hypothetical protein B0H13DRAFT_2357498 [Mycena leptocephala]|nr:hypothetical protein B0H13DRAFT_2357498 [Mycena leptocephala]